MLKRLLVYICFTLNVSLAMLLVVCVSMQAQLAWLPGAGGDFACMQPAACKQSLRNMETT